MSIEQVLTALIYGGGGSGGSSGGNVPDITAGTVTTLPAGSDATAEVIKTGDNSYSINLGIPAGRDGVDGSKGDTGNTPILEAGTIETLSPDEQVKVTITEKEEGVYALNIGIPAGRDGAPGRDGTDGRNGVDGLTPVLRSGTATELSENAAPTVELVEDTPNVYKLNVGIPRGRTGDKGDAALELKYVYASTLAAGEKATARLEVMRSSDSDDAYLVLYLGIPKGDKGATGDKGKDATNVVPYVTAIGENDTASVEVLSHGGDQGTYDSWTFKLPRGKTGADGATPTLVAGATSTLAAGSNAKVDITPTGNNTYAISLGIPRGADGKNGSDGRTPLILAGTCETLPYGSTPTVELVDAHDDTYLLDLGIPEGKPGAGGASKFTNGNVSISSITSTATEKQKTSVAPNQTIKFDMSYSAIFKDAVNDALTGALFSLSTYCQLYGGANPPPVIDPPPFNVWVKGQAIPDSEASIYTGLEGTVSGYVFNSSTDKQVAAIITGTVNMQVESPQSGDTDKWTQGNISLLIQNVSSQYLDFGFSTGGNQSGYRMTNITASHASLA